MFRGRATHVIVALTLLCGVVHVLGLTLTTGVDGVFVQGDARSYFAYLPSLLLDRDLDLRNQFLELAPTGPDEPTPWGAGPGGVAANPFPIGPALIWLPGYAAGLAIDALTAGLGTGKPLGYGPAATWGAALMTILAVGLGAWLTVRLGQRHGGDSAALLAGVAVWLGTPLLYYTIVTPLYSHGVGWFAVAAFLYLLPQEDSASIRRWIGCGVAGGFMVATRLQDAPLLLVAVVLVASQLSRRDATARELVALAIGGFMGYLPQGYTWYRLYGTIIPIEPDAATRGFSPAKLYSVLLSTGHEGWISWSPVVALGLVGLALLGRHGLGTPAGRLALGGLFATAGVILLDVVHPYGAGSAFGGRRYISLGPLIAVGLVALLPHFDRRSAAQKGTGGPARNPLPMVIAGLAALELWLLAAYQLLAIRHGVYGTLLESVRFGLGLGPPS